MGPSFAFPWVDKRDDLWPDSIFPSKNRDMQDMKW